MLAGLLAIAMAITPVYAAIQENTSQYDPSSWVTNRQGPSDQRFNEFVSITVGPITEDNVTINVSAPNYTRNQSGAVRKTYWSTAIQYSVDGGPWYSTDPYHKDGSLAWAGYDKAVSASVTIPRTGAARRVAVRSLILRYVFEDMASQTRKTYMYYYNHPRSVLIPAKGFYAATQTFQSSGVWTAPADGNYQFHVIGRGGDGTGGNSGHGGGGGGYAVHQAYMKKGETANIIISAAQSALSVKGQTVIANAGATGGAGGTASGGNISNQAGTAGQGGIRIIYGYDSDDSAEYEYMGGYGGAAQGAYGGAGGSFSWAGTGQNGLQYGDGGGGCARTSLWGGGTGSAGIGAAGAVIIEAPTDRVPPAILGVNTPSYWVPGAMATISAQDDKSGIVGYAVTKDQNIPSNWQASNQCTIEPGLQYAWAIDALGNISAPFAFTVAVDTDAPVIQDVTVDTVFSDGPTRSDIMIKAEDPVINGSIATGVRWYAVTQTSNPPAQGDWQGDNVFSIEGQGDWYAWAKDVVGNVSEPFPFAPDVDSDAPVIHSVTVDTTFSDGLTYSDITIEAEDPIIDGDAASGVKWYAITQSSDAPTQSDWQGDNVFSIEGQGDWYAWAKDVVGNVSEPFPFAPDVDSDAPVIHSVTVDTTFSDGLTYSDITIEAEDPIIDGDAASGVKWYAITQSSDAPTQSDWQGDNVFSIEGQGDWYAWAKDVVGNVSEPFPFAPDVDSDAPVIHSVTVDTTFSDGLTYSDVTIEAEDPIIDGDAASGVKWYAITQSIVSPSQGDWQEANVFSIEGQGDWYAWAKDVMGNVSKPFPFAPDVDSDAPVIHDVVVDTVFTDGLICSDVIIDAEDPVINGDAASGVRWYAITKSSVFPTEGDWQEANVFSIEGQGDWYAWAKDVMGNVSKPYFITITAPPEYSTKDAAAVVTDPDGKPAEGCIVEIVNGNGTIIGAGETDINGYTKIPEVPVGEYELVIRDSDGSVLGTGSTVVTPDGISGSMTEGDHSVSVFPAEEYITQIITGSVTDQKGNPAIGYIVEIVNRNDRVVGSDLTDRYGYFEIPGIPVGDYSIVIRDPDGNIIGVGSITVGPDQVSGGLTEGNCTITVPANYITQDVVGTIKDHEGNPAIDYLVELIDKYDRVAGSDCTDKNGYFEILGIPVGEYTMVVRDPNGNIVGTGYVSVTPEGVSGELTEGLYTAAISFLAKNQLEEETDKSVYWELALKEVKEKALTGKKSIRLGYLPNYQLPVWWLEELRETSLDVELSFYALNYAKNSAVLWSFHTKDLGSFPASRISYDLETSDDKVSPIVPEGEIVLRQLQVKHLEELPFPFAMEVTTSWLRGKEANLYSFDSQNQTLTLIDTGVIDEERKVKFHLQKGGDYIITVKNN